MNNRLLLCLSSALVCILSVLFLTQTTSAQTSSRISISPLTFDLSANPGESVTNEIKVTNVSESTLQLAVQVENIARTGEQGQVELTEEETSFSLSTWVKANPSNFSLKPKEVKSIAFTISVPANAEPGGHYGSILIGTVSSDRLSDSGASISQRIGSLVLMKVSGQAKQEVMVNRFSPFAFSGDFEDITTTDGKTKVLVPKEAIAGEVKPRKYFSKGPIAFDLITKNTGNVHARPAGFVAIYDIFNRKVAEIAIDQRNVFPDDDRRITVIWPKKNLWGIYYKAKLVAVYGQPQQPVTAETSFWAFPLPVAIAAGVGLSLILLLRKRLGRAIKILIKGT